MDRKSSTGRNRLVQWQQDVSGKLDELKNGQPRSMDCELWRQLELLNGHLAARQKTYDLLTGTNS
jgi:hypothetical protein